MNKKDIELIYAQAKKDDVSPSIFADTLLSIIPTAAPNKITAVFCRTYKEFDDYNFFPKSNFKFIREMKDISRYSISGVILMPFWYDLKSSMEAYDYLLLRYPEFFIKINSHSHG